jgi:transcription elongation factor Elf1
MVVTLVVSRKEDILKRDLICPSCKKKGFASKAVGWKEGGTLKCYHCGEWSNAEDWSLPGVWVKVAERLPKAGKKVICYFKNSHDKDRRIMAFHAPALTIEDDNELEAAEYDEEKDQYFLCEGWYEMNEFDETNWMVSNEITHWMDLPAVPAPE